MNQPFEEKRPQIESRNLNEVFKKNPKLNKPNFYFLMGMLTALVIMVIIFNLIVYQNYS